MTLVPLSCLELWPKEAWELASLKHWLLADSSSEWSRIQIVDYAHMGAKWKELENVSGKFLDDTPMGTSLS